ncbi:MAG: M20 family metallopeptidase [Deltaproteobacteria bacterium]|uniref:M20 family metallopeptidase n=1 Tax=Desulfobacula sp. TaxID=2593537 RepID=UPI0019A8AF8F|nr:M20 family metallopeptidase [Candidatus Desulfobacula maris]MBL6995446.1 M20 family metallopeptidase [Desulfobacula sp.]
MKQYIKTRHENFLSDFKTIVNIDSSSDNKSGIEKVARFFEKRFARIGLDTEILFLGDKKVPCLYAEHRPSKKSFDIMFLGHMDTVFPTGEVEKRPFSITGNRAFGPGVCDMKGGLLVVLHVLETLKHEGILDSLSVCVAFNGDEETGSHASRDWIMSTAKKSLQTFVFEPCRPGYRFVLQRKGGGWFQIIVKGQEAHAGADPEKGINAVVELAHQIVKINQLNQNEMQTSVHVTVISGGDKVNIIPNMAKASVDVRILKLEEKERIETYFKNLPEHTYLKGAQIKVQGHIDRPPMEPGDGTRKLWELIRSTGEQMGLQMESISTGGCSDGNYTSAAGAPTIDGMGIVGANSHRADEYAELDSIDNMVGLVAQVCKAIAEKNKLI